MGVGIPVPRGLSARSRRIWRELTALHAFGAHEQMAFRRALEWWDRSDAWLAASQLATGPDQGRLVKQSLDAAAAALRYWRTLKFIDPGEATRRPGRRSPRISIKNPSVFYARDART